MTSPSFRRFIEGSNDALAEIDGRGLILYTNAHWRQLVGGGGAHGQSVGNWPNIGDALVRSSSGEAFFVSEVPGRGLPVDGALVRMASSANPAMTRMMLRVRLRQAALAGTRDRFYTLIDQFPFAIGVHRDARFLYVNRTAVRYLRYERPDQLVGESIMTIIAESDLPLVRARVAQMMKTGQPLPERETQLVGRDGSRITAELGAFMIHDEDGLPSYVVVARDVSERRALEEKLRQGQRLEAIGRLAGGIAHDFNNVLAVILTYAELLADATPEDEVVEAAREIEQAAKRAVALVQQLLTFARGQASVAELVDPRVVVEALRGFLMRTLGSAIELELDVAPELPRVRLGASQLEQVVLNLAINARDAMPEGGRLVIRVQRVESQAESRPESTRDATIVGGVPGTCVVIEVIDEGTGMNEEAVRRAFEPFFSTKGPGKGTGLGLSTVYGIARQAGGTAEITSSLGVGTAVRIVLPAVSEDGRDALDAMQVIENKHDFDGDVKDLLMEGLSVKPVTHHALRGSVEDGALGVGPRDGGTLDAGDGVARAADDGREVHQSELTKDEEQAGIMDDFKSEVNFCLSASRAHDGGDHGAEGAAGASPAGPPPQGATVLVVEDDDAVRTLIGRALKNGGFTAVLTPGPRAARAWVDQVVGAGGTPPAVLLTDVVMPEGSGPELASALRQVWPDLPVVVVSGWSDEPLPTDAEPTRTWFVAKPFSNAELLRVVAVAAGGAARTG